MFFIFFLPGREANEKNSSKLSLLDTIQQTLGTFIIVTFVCLVVNGLSNVNVNGLSNVHSYCHV